MAHLRQSRCSTGTVIVHLCTTKGRSHGSCSSGCAPGQYTHQAGYWAMQQLARRTVRVRSPSFASVHCRHFRPRGCPQHVGNLPACCRRHVEIRHTPQSGCYQTSHAALLNARKALPTSISRVMAAICIAADRFGQNCCQELSWRIIPCKQGSFFGNSRPFRRNCLPKKCFFSNC